MSIALMHSFSARSDLEISMPSFLYWVSCAWVSPPFSSPARSMNLNRPLLVSPPTTLNWRIVWDLELLLFLSVFETILDFLQNSNF